MADQPSGPAVDTRLRAFLAAELRQAELDFPYLRRRERAVRRQRFEVPVGIVAAAVVVAAIVALAPRFQVPGPGERGSTSSAIPTVPSPAVPSPSVTPPAGPSPFPPPSASPSPSPIAGSGVLVDCGRISSAACATAIDLARAGSDVEVAGATRIVVDDTCDPAITCDRLYPFDSIVVFVTAGGDTTGWYAISVVGLVENTPTTVEPWVGEIPAHVLDTLLGPQPTP